MIVTDAISAMGLEEGRHHIGQFNIEIRDRKAYIAGTDTLCGSIATMNECVKLFLKATGKQVVCTAMLIYILNSFPRLWSGMCLRSG